MNRNDAPIMVVMTVLLAGCVFGYYTEVHPELMPSYPHKLKGISVHVASILIGFVLSYFLKITWDERSNLIEVFKPTIGRLTYCTVLAALTPVGNLMWIPIPFGPLLLLQISNGRWEAADTLHALLVLSVTYGVACLSAVHVPSFGRLVGPTVLHLVGAFVAATLFKGVSYI